MSFRFVVCDDHPLINDSIELFFSRKGHSCIAKLMTNNELISFFNNSKVDVLICDLNIDQENTFKILEVIKIKNPELYIIIFSAYSDRIFIQKAKEIGISLYISKTSNLTDLYNEIDLKKTEFYTNCHFPKVKKMFLETEFQTDFEILKLSDQEKKIVTLILAGEKSESIAKKLFISKFTVDTHRKNINKKLNVSGIMELQEKVLKYNLI
jgi:DNA-binding NarL/FixJ family response regulator